MKRCCFIACCCSCLLVLALIIAAAGGVFYVVKKGMEPPVGYVKSSVPLEVTKGAELVARIEKGTEAGQLELSLTKQDLRNIVAAKLDAAMRDSTDRVPVEVIDVQVDFGSPAELPAVALPKAYPVPLDKSVRLDFIAAVNFAKKGDEPFVVYPLIKVLAGVNDCGLYWAPVDFGVGPYNVLSLLQYAQQAGGKTTTADNTSSVEKVPLPVGTCVTELTRDGENLRLVFGPEAGAPPAPGEPATPETPAEP